MNEKADSQKYALDIHQIRKYMPHRPPFLLIDRVLEIHPVGSLDEFETGEKTGVRVIAQKCVSINEPFFSGHFPEYPIMPGVLILEAMAQAACFSLYPYMLKKGLNLGRDFRVFFVGANQTRFRKPVSPGDVLRFETEVLKRRGVLWIFKAQTTVDGAVVAEAEIMANLIRTEESAAGT